MTWYLEYALRSGATTWSMEQVSVPAVVEAVERIMRLYPGQLDYCIVDCFRLGVPQHRKRLIAGTPRLIRKLRMRRMRPRVVKDVIPHPRGTHTRPNATGATARFTKAGALTLRGMVAVSDTLKPEAHAVLSHLQARGLECWMVTGDNARTALYVAARAGLPPERVLAEVEPRKYRDMFDREQTGCTYMSKAASGEYEMLTHVGFHRPIPIAFPSIVALSHMWLDPSHCDPEAKVRPHRRLAL